VNRKFKIVEFIIGDKSSFYSIQFEGKSKSEAQEFFEKYENKYAEEIEDIADNIFLMSGRQGSTNGFFKLKEGKIDDNVCAISEGDLRLYCLRYGNIAVILGSGGIKPKGVGTYQDIPILNKAVKELQDICKLIDYRIKSEEIYWQRYELKGELEFKTEEL